MTFWREKRLDGQGERTSETIQYDTNYANYANYADYMNVNIEWYKKLGILKIIEPFQTSGKEKHRLQPHIVAFVFPKSRPGPMSCKIS